MLTVYNRDIAVVMHICCAFAVVVWRTFRGTTTAILGFFSIQEILKISTGTGPLVLPSLLKKQPYFGDPITVLYYFSPTFCFHVHRRDPAAEPVFTLLRVDTEISMLNSLFVR